MAWWESGFAFGSEQLAGMQPPTTPRRPIRVTDVVRNCQEAGDLPGAVRVVRTRRPDGSRWRAAVGSVARHSVALPRCIERYCAEEALREVVLEVPDRDLRVETVLDVRLHGMDLDRGDVLPRWRIGELRRVAYLLDLELDAVAAHIPLPDGFERLIDTPGVILMGRHLAGTHRHNAQRQLRRLPDQMSAVSMSPTHRKLLDTASWSNDRARRWTTLSEHLVNAR